MLGMIFTELHEFVENAISFDVADAVLERAELRGVWAATGYYDDAQLAAYVGALSEITGTPRTELLHVFGQHLLTRFAAMHPEFFSEAADVFALLSGLESQIHTQVRALWPEAQIPPFHVTEHGAGLTLHYRSPRGLAALAKGLIDAAIAHYGEPCEVEVRALVGETEVDLVLTRRTA